MATEFQMHFTDEDWNRIERDWSAFWAGELDRPMIVLEGIEPAEGKLPEAPAFVTNLPLDMPADEVVDRYGAHLETQRFYGDAWPKWWLNFGPGIMAGFVGARVQTAPDTVWFEPVQKTDIENIRLQYDPENVWFKRVMDLTETAVRRWGDQACVSHTDLGGNLDILASLRTTEQLLLDLMDAPKEVARLVGEITKLWLRYYDELYEIIAPAGRGTTPWAPIWSPGKTYMLQCDFAYMISPDMFERFVLPDLADCCDYLDHGFYHLDGKGQIPHVDLLLSLDRLRGIQWVPGAGQPEADQWLPLLKRIRDGGKRCQVSVSAEGANTIVRELGGKGFVFHVGGQWNAEDADAFVRTLTS